MIFCYFCIVLYILWPKILQKVVLASKKFDFNQRTVCGAPVRLSKYTTLIDYHRFSNPITPPWFLLQAKAFLNESNQSQFERNKRRKHLMERLSSATLFSSVSTVLETFKKAKERMAKATELYNEAQWDAKMLYILTTAWVLHTLSAGQNMHFQRFCDPFQTLLPCFTSNMDDTNFSWEPFAFVNVYWYRR